MYYLDNEILYLVPLNKEQYYRNSSNSMYEYYWTEVDSKYEYTSTLRVFSAIFEEKSERTF